MLSSDSEQVALSRTLTAMSMFYEALGTEQARALKDCLEKGDFLSLVNASVKARDYSSCHSFSLDYAAVSFARKLEGLPTPIDREAVALSAFKRSEDRCASTNVRFMNARPFNNGVEQLLNVARGKIESIIGATPDLTKVLGLMQWGPGATATIKGDDVRPESKILEPRLSVSPKAYRLAKRVVGNDMHWCRARLDVPKDDETMSVSVDGPCTLTKSEFQIVHYMRVVTVPKDSRTDRTIGVEPTMNTYMQQGVGRLLRSKLAGVGVDLSDQSWNQTLARVAQMAGLCTVDLSSASDTIAYWLVEDLLPPAWFQLLDALRSSHALMPCGDIRALEKFSSMGNAYTFELESLIFYALSYAVCVEGGFPTEFLSIYGDDIIVDRRAYARLDELFRVCGFSINLEKSFAHGRFYESCGTHYFDGDECTPMYQKELLYGLPELARLHNRILRWCERAFHSPSRFLRLTSWLRKEARIIADRNNVALPRVPYGTEGDAGFWTNNLRVSWCDGAVLLHVLEVIPSEVDTTSFSAILSVALKRGDQVDGDETIEALRVHNAFDGTVSLRDNNPKYRVRQRWILTTSAVVTTQEGWKQFDGFRRPGPHPGDVILIPQLRCHATLI